MENAQPENSPLEIGENCLHQVTGEKITCGMRGWGWELGGGPHLLLMNGNNDDDTDEDRMGEFSEADDAVCVKPGDACFDVPFVFSLTQKIKVKSKE